MRVKNKKNEMVAKHWNPKIDLKHLSFRLCNIQFFFSEFWETLKNTHLYTAYTVQYDVRIASKNFSKELEVVDDVLDHAKPLTKIWLCILSKPNRIL